MKLTAKARDEYEKMLPFYVQSETGVVKITDVSRKHFQTENGYLMNIRANQKTYATPKDFDALAKYKIASEAVVFFAQYKEKYEYYTKFFDENPEYFI